MSNTSPINKVYDSLIDSITAMFHVGKSIIRDNAALSSYAAYLSNNKDEIAKFVQTKTQVESFLDRYDFKGGFQFDDMNKKIDSLLLLRSKLATMGEEAKKLSVHPDRYGSQRAIELGRDFAITCKERLKLEEADKAIALAESITQKLISIRSQFESDGDVLYQINEAIDSNMNVLGKFKAYLAEIRRYVDAFPHSGQDDLGEINSRISAAKQINTLLEKTQKSVDSIKSYADRHNKKAVVTLFQSIVDEMSSKMCYADIEKYKSKLGDNMKQAQKVVTAFEEERNELQGVYDSLLSRSSDKWKDDTESMIEKVGELLSSDTKTRIFDLSKLKGDIKEFVYKRSKDIKDTLNEHPWLENDQHYGFHSNLVNSYITKSYYYSQVEYARKERLKKIWKWVGISTGIVGGVLLIINYWKVVLTVLIIAAVILFFIAKD